MRVCSVNSVSSVAKKLSALEYNHGKAGRKLISKILLKGGTMFRREFLKTGVAGAATFAALQSRAFAEAGDKRLRVGLIGCGWYGKTDLFHLMQVAPVDVVGLC